MKAKVYYKGCPYYGRPLQIEYVHTMDVFNYINWNKQVNKYYKLLLCQLAKQTTANHFYTKTVLVNMI